MAANLREQYDAAQQGAKTSEKGAKTKDQRPKRAPGPKQSQGESRAPGGERRKKSEGSFDSVESVHSDAFVPGRPFQPQKQRRDRRVAGQRPR